MDFAQTLTTMRELDSRTTDGIHVRLLWSEQDGRVAVSVADSKTDEAFVIDVRAADDALDVFHHPYAHAAWRGIETSAGAGGPALIGLLAA